MDKPNILVFAGALRKDSYNKILARAAAKAVDDAGGKATYIDLKDYPLPVYDGDIETAEGLPAAALKLKELMWQSDGFLIAAPEYNSSISAPLKNMIDWTSRQAKPEEVYLSCFIGKVAALMSTSPSALGGLRGLVHLRDVLENVYTMVLPEQKCISNCAEAFDSDGSIKSDHHRQSIQQICQKLVKTIQKLKA
jgi:chromate reductase